jgi:hypothetical protein
VTTRPVPGPQEELQTSTLSFLKIKKKKRKKNPHRKRFIINNKHTSYLWLSLYRFIINFKQASENANPRTAEALAPDPHNFSNFLKL